jgi:hypothetical protein
MNPKTGLKRIVQRAEKIPYLDRLLHIVFTTRQRPSTTATDSQLQGVHRGNIARRLLPALGRRIWPIARSQILQRLNSIEQQLQQLKQLPLLRADIDTAMKWQTELQDLYRAHVNLTESVPVALRKIHWDINKLKLDLEQKNALLESIETKVEAMRSASVSDLPDNTESNGRRTLPSKGKS